MTTTSTGPEAPDVAGGVRSILFDDGWLEFNRFRWGVTPERVRFAREGKGLPAVEAVYYLNRRGQIWKPTTTNPYLPLVFLPTPTQSSARLDHQWLDVGLLLAADMRERGLANPVTLAPEIDDVRPWIWTGFRTSVRYTYHLALPYDAARQDPSVHRQIAKAARAGFRAERVEALDDVFACIDGSQQRRHFDYKICPDDLRLARELIGADRLRTYVCYAPNGEPASARVILHQPGWRAIDWLVGTRDRYLPSGATQFLLASVLEDLAQAGARGFDFEGANLPGVAASKATWGGRLVPFMTIEAPHLRGGARRVRSYLRFKRQSRE